MENKRENLYKLYWEENLPLKQIANRLNIPVGSIGRIFKILGIPKRSQSEANYLAYKSGNKKRLFRADHPNWKGGLKKATGGYIRILNPEHPRADNKGYVARHILVWEQSHGQPVPEGYEVHHLNGIRGDNRPENLIALSKKIHSHNSPLRLQIKALKERVRYLEQELKTIANQKRLL